MNLLEKKTKIRLACERQGQLICMCDKSSFCESYPVLFCLVQSFPDLSRLVPSCPVLCSLVPSCPVLSRLVQSCPVLSCLVPSCPVLTSLVQSVQSWVSLGEPCKSYLTLLVTQSSKKVKSSRKTTTTENLVICKTLLALAVKNVQLHKGAFIINEFLRNAHFSELP